MVVRSPEAAPGSRSPTCPLQAACWHWQLETLHSNHLKQAPGSARPLPGGDVVDGMHHPMHDHWQPHDQLQNIFYPSQFDILLCTRRGLSMILRWLMPPGSSSSSSSSAAASSHWDLHHSFAVNSHASCFLLRAPKLGSCILF